MKREKQDSNLREQREEINVQKRKYIDLKWSPIR